jgi:epoxyqueuosine reductase
MQTQFSDSSRLEDKIKAEAYRLGFSLCGFTTPESPAGFDRYVNWLSRDLHAGMAYLDSPHHRTVRQHPDQLMPGVKSIISLAWPYNLTQPKPDDAASKALIAGYVAGTDYHLLLPAKLDELAGFIKKETVLNIKAQAFTDSAPILEREIASRAGLGWIGKNTNLINPSIGSAFLLAELFIDYPLQPDQPITHDRCGTCQRCLDACPTACIQNDRTIDSSRCISYLTIENKGSIPEELRSSFGEWMFGCDVCQTVCPWNHTNQNHLLQSQEFVLSIDQVENLLSISTSEFTNRFKDSALNRSKLKGFQRNALIWLGNNGKPSQSELIETFLQQTTDTDLIEASHWTISKLRTK